MGVAGLPAPCLLVAGSLKLSPLSPLAVHWSRTQALEVMQSAKVEVLKEALSEVCRDSCPPMLLDVWHEELRVRLPVSPKTAVGAKLRVRVGREKTAGGGGGPGGGGGRGEGECPRPEDTAVVLDGWRAGGGGGGRGGGGGGGGGAGGGVGIGVLKAPWVQKLGEDWAEDSLALKAELESVAKAALQLCVLRCVVQCCAVLCCAATY